jgi:hypothetical protein
MIYALPGNPKSFSPGRGTLGVGVKQPRVYDAPGVFTGGEIVGILSPP